MSRKPAKVKYVDRPTTHNSARDGSWAEWHAEQYAKGAAANEEAKIAAMIKKAEKARKTAESGKPRKVLEGRALELANARRDAKAQAKRQAQVFLATTPKLPSEAHPILRLWVQKLPKSGRLATGAYKDYVTKASGKLLGLRQPYVACDRNMLGFIRIDLDEIFDPRARTDGDGFFFPEDPGGRPRRVSESFNDLKNRIVSAGAPMANIAVGSADGADRLLTPHVIFLLKDSVYCGPGCDPKFKAKYDAIARRLVAAMIEIGADPGGLSNGCKAKNPLATTIWSHRVLREEPWALDELDALLPVKVSTRQLERKYAAHLATQEAKTGVVQDHADPVIASESNQAHRFVCKAAQAAVRQFRATSTFEAFQEFVQQKASEVCPDQDTARKKADYVAPWTWKNFKGRVPGQKLDPVVVRQARKSAIVRINYNRKKDTMSAVVGAIDELSRTLGRKPGVYEIASLASVSEASVRRYRPGGTFYGASQQNEVICPQNTSPRHGVVKKVLLDLEHEKGIEKASSCLVDQAPVEHPTDTGILPASEPTIFPPAEAVPVLVGFKPGIPEFLRSLHSPVSPPPWVIPSGATSLPVQTVHTHHGG